MAQAKKEAGTELARMDDVDGPLASGDAITKFSGSAKDLIDEGFSAEVIHTLQDGEAIRGVFAGPGGAVEVSDPNTGELRQLPTWRVRAKDGGLVVSLLGAAQLNARLAGVAVGTEIFVQRKGKTRTTKGRNCNNYLVFTK